MNVYFTAALLLCVTTAIFGDDAASQAEPTTTKPLEKAAEQVKAALKAAADQKTKADVDSKSKDTDKKSEVKDGEKKEGKDVVTQKMLTATVRKGKLKHPNKPMNDAAAAAAAAGKDKDKTEKQKDDAKTAAKDDAKGKTAAVTVAQDTATKGNGVTSHHLADWKLVAVTGVILNICLCSWTV